MDIGFCLDGLVLDAAVYLSGVTALGLGLLGAWVATHDPFFGKRYFLIAIGAMSFWLAAASAELAMPSLSCKMAIATTTWIGITLTPIAWTLFIWHYCFSRPLHATGAIMAGVSALVLTIAAAALSNPAHGLFYGPETTLVVEAERPFVRFDHGPLFYAAAAVLYVFLSIALAITTVASLRAPRPLRPMMMVLLCATVVPITANLAYVLMDAKLFGFDPTPFAFSFVLIGVTWVIYATRGFDLGMLARDLLYFNLMDPVLVLNTDGLVTNANPAATRVLPDFTPGKRIDPGSPLAPAARLASGAASVKTQHDITLGKRSFDMRVLPIRRPLGQTGGWLGVVVILTEVTLLKLKNKQLTEALEMSHAHLNEVTRLRETAERLALVDPLTGISNRRSMMEWLDALSGRPLAMALIDLDHFKQVNDKLGHLVGDRVLCDFTAMVRKALPPGVEFFRVGGEEFVLVMPDGSTSHLLALLEQIKTALIEVPPLRAYDHPKLTISAGVAEQPADGENFDALYTAADARLYEAKRGGRNRIVN